MNSSMIIEAIGYVGSALVLVSFLMVSVVKLRIVNSIGSIIFTIYAFIIHSYPTAIMNLCLVAINIYYLIKMSNTGDTTRDYDLIEVNTNDSMLRYTIDRQMKNIQESFPGISTDFSNSNSAFLICYNGTPAGVFIGTKDANGVMDIQLDYSLPEFRDFSIGNFIFSKLSERGVNTITYSGPDEHHKAYLNKYNFVKKENYYLKVL